MGYGSFPAKLVRFNEEQKNPRKSQKQLFIGVLKVVFLKNAIRFS